MIQLSGEKFVQDPGKVNLQKLKNIISKGAWQKTLSDMQDSPLAFFKKGEYMYNHSIVITIMIMIMIMIMIVIVIIIIIFG